MNCDRIAGVYRWIEHAVFGKALERRREAFLSELAEAGRALALGDGDGRALVALLAAAPYAQVQYIDVSSKMLELAKARVLAANPADAGRVAFQRADARTASLGESQYDLIVTHFFLDCFDHLELLALVDRIALAAKPTARWIVSEFRPATAPARVLIATMYIFFGKVTGLETGRLADHHPALLRSGFRLARAQQAWAGTVVSELWIR